MLSDGKTVSSLCFQFQPVYCYIKEYFTAGISESLEPPDRAPAPGAAAAGEFAPILGGAALGSPNGQPLGLFSNVGLYKLKCRWEINK